MISKYIGRLPPKAMEETYARERSETELDNSLNTCVSRQEMCMWERKRFGAFLYWFLSALRDGFQGCLCPSLISLLLDGPSFYTSSFLWRERLGTYCSGYRLAVAVFLHLRIIAESLPGLCPQPTPGLLSPSSGILASFTHLWLSCSPSPATLFLLLRDQYSH